MLGRGREVVDFRLAQTMPHHIVSCGRCHADGAPMERNPIKWGVPPYRTCRGSSFRPSPVWSPSNGCKYAPTDLLSPLFALSVADGGSLSTSQQACNHV